MAPRLLLIVHGKSREKTQDFSDARALLAEHSERLKLFFVDDPRQIPPLLTSYCRKPAPDYVVLGGGDGTLNTAVEAVLKCGLPLGILPMGSANDLARSLRIPTDLVVAAKVIIDGAVRRIDLGWVNGKHFFNAAQLGLAQQVTRGTSTSTKRFLGRFSYAINAMSALRNRRAFHARVTYDGSYRKLHSLQITVGNGRFYGGGTVIHSDADIVDSVLDLFSIKPQTVLDLIKLAPLLRRGEQYKSERVDHIRGKEFYIRTKRPMPIATDGEITAYTPARFKVIPDALAVLVPRETGSK